MNMATSLVPKEQQENKQNKGHGPLNNTKEKGLFNESLSSRDSTVFMLYAVHTDLAFYQYTKELDKGPDSDASSSSTRAPASGTESRRLAERLKHHRQMSTASFSET